MKILIVEDEPSLRELMQRTLEKERYVVEVAATYGQALQKIEDYSYDCILLDIMLPDGDGLSILGRLKAMPSYEKIPVVLLTAKTSEYDKVKGLDAGAELWNSSGLSFEAVFVTDDNTVWITPGLAGRYRSDRPYQILE